MIHHFKRATRLLIFWLLVASAVGISGARIFLAGIENYKAGLENKFRELTGIHLHIGSLSAGTRGFNPEIILQDIDILSVDEKGLPAATLTEVRLGVDVMQLLLSGEVLSSSWLTLVGVKVAVVRHEDGSLSIKGLNTDSNERPLWLAQTGKYEILRSEISWLDEKRAGEKQVFRNLDLLIKNHNSHHELHLISELPAQFGESLRISAALNGDILAGDNLGGRLYVLGRDIRLAEFPVDLLPSGIAVVDGSSDFELWSDWAGSKLNRLSADIRVKNIAFRQQSGETLTVDSMSGLLDWSSVDDGWRFDASNLQVAVSQRQWPAAEFHVEVKQDNGFSAWIPKMELRELSELGAFFLSPEQSARLPKDIAVAGGINNMALFVSGDRHRFAVNGTFNDVAATSADDMPQFSGLSGYIHGYDETGVLSLDSRAGKIAFPGLFREAIALDRLSGQVEWRQGQSGWVLASPYLVANNDDLETQSRFTLIAPEDEQPLTLDMHMAFAGRGDASRAPGYFPVGIMEADVVDWLDHAFIAGRVANGEMLLSGKLSDFPFESGQGKFEVKFDVADATLNYHPEWPSLQQLDAGVHFFADSLRVKIDHAESSGVQVRQASVDIPTLSDADYLMVNGALRGRIADGLRFMQQTPLHATVDGVLRTAEITGATDVDLALKIPLSENLPETVNGTVHLRQAGMTVKPIALQIDELTGDFRFTEQGLFSERLDGKALGFPIQANIATADGMTRIEIEGKSDMRHLQEQFSFLRNGIARGSLSYVTQLEIPVAEGKAPNLHIQSDLRGMTLDLPEPLGKSDKQAKKLQIDMTIAESGRLPVRIAYDTALNSALLIDRETETLFAGNILFGPGQANYPNEAGLKLVISQPGFDVSAWAGLLAGEEGEQRPYWSSLNEISVDIGQLRWERRSLGNLQLDLKRIGQYWQGNLTSLPAQGAVSIPVTSADGDKTTLHMAYLDLSKLSELDLPVAWLSSEKVPLIEIFSEHLRWLGVDLGKLELETERRQQGVHFNKIRLIGPDSRIDLTADWFRSGDEDMTQFKGRLNSDDFGKLLGKLGYNDDLWDTAAAVEVSGYWLAAPYQFSLANFFGEVELMLTDGRISSIEPGFGRLLGLIAMEQWVKRFSLDFSDIYQQGLAFNRITGKFFIREGKAYTDNLLIDAVAARVKIYGVADLQKHTLNHNVLVVPKSSGAVPIAGTIVGGIASIVTQVLTDDYKEGYFFGSEYKVTGSWDDAQITPLHDRDGLLKKTWSELTDFPWLKSDAK